MPKDFISLADWSSEELLRILDRARERELLGPQDVVEDPPQGGDQHVHADRASDLVRCDALAQFRM